MRYVLILEPDCFVLAYHLRVYSIQQGEKKHIESYSKTKLSEADIINTPAFIMGALINADGIECIQYGRGINLTRHRSVSFVDYQS